MPLKKSPKQKGTGKKNVIPKVFFVSSIIGFLIILLGMIAFLKFTVMTPLSNNISPSNPVPTPIYEGCFFDSCTQCLTNCSALQAECKEICRPGSLTCVPSCAIHGNACRTDCINTQVVSPTPQPIDVQKQMPDP